MGFEYLNRFCGNRLCCFARALEQKNKQKYQFFWGKFRVLWSGTNFLPNLSKLTNSSLKQDIRPSIPEFDFSYTMILLLLRTRNQLMTDVS